MAVLIPLQMSLRFSYTPAELLSNPKLLLHTPPPDNLSVYDGHVGALVRGGESFVTSPNTRRICNPPFGGDRHVYLRSNVRYGQDDPLQWPQPLRSDTLYLAALPIVPRSAAQSSPLSIMYWNPDQSEFDEDRTGLISGIGRINPSHINDVSTPCTQLFKRVDQFMGKDSTPASALELLSEYVPLLRRYLYRVQHLPTTFFDTSFGVRSIQRLYLMITALLDWHEVFLPKLGQNATGAAVAVASVMGAFTTSTEVGDELYRMGIPVWLVRPSSDVPKARVQALKTLIEPSILPLHPHRYKNYSIFTGSNTDPKFLPSIIRELHRHLTYPNPFGLDIAPRDLSAPPMLVDSASQSSFPSSSPSLSSSSVASSSPSPFSSTVASSFPSPFSSTVALSSPFSSPFPSSSSTVAQSSPFSSPSLSSSSTTKAVGRIPPAKKRLTPNSRQTNPAKTSVQGSGRNKFVDPTPAPGVPHILPPLLRLWDRALRQANQSDARNVNHSFDAFDLSYVFPEPASLQAVEKGDRLMSMINMWLRCRPVFLFRLSASNSDATPMSAKAWKDFLSIDYMTPVETPSKSQTRMAKARDFL
ncbi:hypothetical protein BDN72DRAFT_866042, partial [Pluteus cervinus]